MFGFEIVPAAVHTHFPRYEDRMSGRNEQAQLYLDYKIERTTAHRAATSTIHGYTHTNYTFPR